MKIILAEVCIWILRKLKISCIIAMNVNSEFIYGKYKHVFWYDSDLIGVKPTDIYGNILDMSNRKNFRVETFKKEEGI